MRRFLKPVLMALTVAVASTTISSTLSAQCAECRGTEPCAYGPFASKKAACTYVVGLCFEVGVCGESFAANQVEFSLDGMAIVPARTLTASMSKLVASVADSLGAIGLHTRQVFRHCSGLIASVAG